MANRRFNQFPSTIEHKVVMLDGYAEIQPAVVGCSLVGGFGANNGLTRTGVGTYQLVLADHYWSCLGAQLTMCSQGTEALFVQVINYLSDGQSGPTVAGGTFTPVAPISASTGLANPVGQNINAVSFKTVNSSGVATDTTVGCGVSIHLPMRNSSV